MVMSGHNGLENHLSNQNDGRSDNCPQLEMDFWTKQFPEELIFPFSNDVKDFNKTIAEPGYHLNTILRIATLIAPKLLENMQLENTQSQMEEDSFLVPKKCIVDAIRGLIIRMREGNFYGVNDNGITTRFISIAGMANQPAKDWGEALVRISITRGWQGLNGNEEPRNLLNRDPKEINSTNHNRYGEQTNK